MIDNIYVVPDDQIKQIKQQSVVQQLSSANRQAYGNEVQRMDTQGNLNQMLQSIQAHRANDPVYSPFASGTKTVQQKQLDENQRQANITAAADLSKAFGIGVQPKTSGQELFKQVEGLPTWDRQYQQQALENQRNNALLDYDAAMNRSAASTEKPADYYDRAIAASDLYRSYDDYYSDITKNRATLITKMGASNYEKLLESAEALRENWGDNWEEKNNWKPGTKSPIGELLNPNVPTSGKTGISSDIVSVVNKVAAKYDVDPALILAIGQHETGWGKLGDGRKGMYTGYGSYDSGSDYSNAGLEKQVEGTARKMKAWGMSRGNVSLDRLKTGNSGKLPTGIYATDKNWPNAIWNYYQKYRG